MALALLLLALLTARFVPVAIRNIRLFFLQRQCLDHTAATDTVVASTDQAIAAVVADDPFRSFYDAYSFPGSLATGTVFMHERKSPAGNRRLVAVEVIVQGQQILLNPRVFTIGTLLRAAEEKPQSADLRRFDVGSARVFAGQPDPHNPCHFTIRFDGTKSGVIDGWLKDDDTVLLELRR